MATINEAARFNALAYVVIGVNPGNPDESSAQFMDGVGRIIPTGWRAYAVHKDPSTGQTDVVFTNATTHQAYIAARGTDGLGDVIGPDAKILFGGTPNDENNAALAYLRDIKVELSAKGYTSFQGGGHSLGGEEMAYVSSKIEDFDVLIENAPNTVDTTGQGSFGDSHVVQINQSNDIIGNWGPSYSNTITIDTGAWTLNQFLFSSGTHSIDGMNAWIAGQPGVADQQLGSIDPIEVAVSGVKHITWGGTGTYGTPAPVTTQGDMTTYLISDGSEVTLSLTDEGQVSTWSKPDGSSGSNTLNFDGSSTETTISSDGVSSTRTVDVDGNTLTQNYDASGTLAGSTWNNVDGSAGIITTSSSYYNSIAKNSDGSMSYTYYSLVNNASHNPAAGGFTSTINADNSGSGMRYYEDGSLAGAWTIKPDGSISWRGNNQDGSLAYECAIDADKSLTYTWHEANGITETGTFSSDKSRTYIWHGADGSSATGAFSADGSGSGADYHLDGTVTKWFLDAGGLGTAKMYAPDGRLVGTVTINGWAVVPNESGMQVAYRSDGGISTIHNTHADITYNLDGSLSGMSLINPDGSSSWLRFSTDGSLVSSLFGTADGVTADAGFGDYFQLASFITSGVGVINNGHPNEIDTGRNITYRDGTLETYLPNGDGSYSGARYGPGGSLFSTSYANSGVPNTLTYYGASEVFIGHWNPDGSGMFISAERYYADGSSEHSTYNPDGSISSQSRYSPDGSYIEYAYSADGSHSEIYYDVNGVPTTTVVDSNGNSTVTGGSRNNTLTGGAGADTLIGGAGNDVLDGGNGSDTYVFNAGDGVDSIQDSGATGTDTVAFGQGITPDSLSLGLGSLLIKVGTGNDAIHIKNFNPNNVYGSPNIENFRFADGTVLTYNQLVSRGFDIQGSDGNDTLNGTNAVDRLYGFNGNDRLYGGDGDDILDGGGGNDYLDGGLGNDTYLFGRGDGQDTISSSTFLFQNSGNVVQLKAGIQPSDVVVTRQNDNLILKIAGTQDQLTISSYFYNEGGSILPLAVKAIQFAGGSPAWDYAIVKMKSLQATDGNDWLIGTSGSETIAGLGGDDQIGGGAGNDTLQGNAGLDTLYGGDGNDILDGGSGDDLLNGGPGNDTYLFGTGAGHDMVVDYDTAASTVRMSAEISPENVTVTRDGANLYLSLNSGTDQLNLSNWFNGYTLRKLRVEFANGATWDAAALLARLPGATAGNDWLAGDSGDNMIDGLGGNDQIWGIGGNDTLSGGTGDDYLQGDAGNDVYLFGPGFGLDTVSDYDTTAGNVDTVKMA
ncbi:MAG: hypothetical protein NTY41_01970, partial [Proteobacteria bacterium]|nr:hypothetical protein [Pseudomonadota bacterium]